jgi:hypothetical protein
MLAKQILCLLNLASSPIALIILEMGSPEVLDWAGFESQFS